MRYLSITSTSGGENAGGYHDYVYDMLDAVGTAPIHNLSPYIVSSLIPSSFNIVLLLLLLLIVV